MDRGTFVFSSPFSGFFLSLAVIAVLLFVHLYEFRLFIYHIIFMAMFRSFSPLHALMQRPFFFHSCNLDQATASSCRQAWCGSDPGAVRRRVSAAAALLILFLPY